MQQNRTKHNKIHQNTPKYNKIQQNEKGDRTLSGRDDEKRDRCICKILHWTASVTMLLPFFTIRSPSANIGSERDFAQSTFSIDRFR